MTGTGRLVGVTALLIIALGASLTILPDVYLQIFSLWIALEILLRQWFFEIHPNPLKTLSIAASLVLLTRGTTQALMLSAGDVEQFIVDWETGPTEQTETCGPVGPVGPGSDIWSDPEKIIDKRIDHALEETKETVREVEKWLRVNTPNEYVNTSK